MECEENLPAPRESLRTDLELGTVLLGREPIIDRYYRIAKELAAHYRITLCDEPEAQLIGSTVWSSIFISRGREVADMRASDHLHFLRNYLNLHGLDSSATSGQVRRVLDWRSRGVMGDAWDALSGEYSIAAADVVAEIRRLAGTHSRPTNRSAPAVQAATGGTIIRGGSFDFPACVPGDARAFRARARRGVNGHYSRAASGTAGGGTPGSAYARYQVNKCGDREYSLRTDATARSYAPLADGLAPTAPPRAKRGYGFACCILEAKYTSSPRTTPYQRRRDFLRNTSSTATRFLPRRFQGMGRPGLIAYWEYTRAEQAGQFGLYMGAIADPDIPYWKVVYICSRDMVRDYFQDIINLARVPRAVAVACTSDARVTTENWIV